MDEVRRCSGCRYFDRLDGLCRFTAPSPVGWPSTTQHDWCGEWTAKRTVDQAGEMAKAGWGVSGREDDERKFKPGARR